MLRYVDSLEFEDGGHSPVRADPPDEIVIRHIDRAIRGHRQGLGRQETLPAGLSLALRAPALQGPLGAVPHERGHHQRLVLEVDVAPVPLLQDALVEVVFVLDVQVPAPDVTEHHLVAGHLDRLDVPHQGAVAVLVPHLDGGRGHPVHPLPVDVEPVPVVGELDLGVSLEHLLLEHTLDANDEVDPDQGVRHRVRGQLELDGGVVALGAAAVVHQPDVAAGDEHGLLHHLGLGEHAGHARQAAGAGVACLPRGQHYRGDQARVMVGTRVHWPVQLRHLHVHLLVGELDGGEDHHLVPWNVEGQAQWGVGVAAKLEHDGAPAIDHEVKPPVLAGHREPFIGAIGGHSHSDETHTIWGHNLASDHGSSTKIMGVLCRELVFEILI